MGSPQPRSRAWLQAELGKALSVWEPAMIATLVDMITGDTPRSEIDGMVEVSLDMVATSDRARRRPRDSQLRQGMHASTLHMCMHACVDLCAMQRAVRLEISGQCRWLLSLLSLPVSRSWSHLFCSCQCYVHGCRSRFPAPPSTVNPRRCMVH